MDRFLRWVFAASAYLLLLIVVGSSRADDQDDALAEALKAEEPAAKALRGISSNLQKNRDGTVRFLRFSKSIVTDEHLKHLQPFKKLDYLAVICPKVSDAGVANVRGLTNLDTLYLSHTQLTDKGLAALTQLEKLERLYLTDTRITDAGFVHLAGLKSLQLLSLENTATTDAGLAQLEPLTNLQTLYLTDTKITDAGLRHLKPLQELRTLKLKDTAISDSGLNQLKDFGKLENLDLTGANVSDAAVDPLSQLKNLKQLTLYQTQLSDKAAAELRAALPKTSIHLSPRGGQERSALQRYLAGEKLREPAAKNPANSVAIVADQPVLPPAKRRFTKRGVIPDFQRHVIPLLGRLGCNGRTCHGSFQGQGGFRLSMFGYDFDADLLSLAGGDEPRVDLMSPAESLILNKPSSDDPDEHGGGQRFKKGGWEYQLLLNWIDAGAKGLAKDSAKFARLEVTPQEIVFGKPGESSELKAVAVWSDGSREDVTCLTRFQTNDETVAAVTPDGRVTCKTPGDTYIVSFYDNGIFSTQVLLPVTGQTDDRYPKVPTPTRIDELVVDKLSKLGIVPSELSTDAEFLRRVSLDLIGTLPTAEEVTAFVEDKSSTKRSQKIDELLESPAYVEWWTVRFSDLTGSNSQYLGSTDMNSPAASQWNAWIRRRVKDNVGWDRIAAGLILAESRRPGQTYEEYVAEQSRHLSRKEPTDFTALENPMHYYWFRSNNLQPVERALSFGYIFLGVRLQCAQCHKHPFDQWSKHDFEEFTQFFTRIKSGSAPDAREPQLALKHKLGVPVKLDTAALRRQMYLRVAAEGLPIPWNEIYIDPPGKKPHIAKLLGDVEFDLNEYGDPREPLMAWLVNKDNSYFARSFVNRIWSHYFGVGIVDPPDDFNLANPPSNKALLDWLAQEFVEHKYDIKWLHRTIVNSRTYQLSWRPNDSNRKDERNFSHSLIRRLPAEVTIDAILEATANDARAKTFATVLTGRKIGQHPRSIQARGIDYSLLVFGKPLRTTNCDCERQMQPTLLQSLYVRNDHEMLEWLERSDGWLVQTARQLGQTLSPEVKVPKTAVKKAEAKPAEPAQVDELIRTAYLRTVNRSPRDEELKRAREHVGSTENTVEGLRDLMWVLLNTQEFLTNH